jgi:hypothetical protein
MCKRLSLGLMTALLMAPALHAAPHFGQSTGNMSWENLAGAALEAICHNFGLCLVSMP